MFGLAITALLLAFGAVVVSSHDTADTWNSSPVTLYDAQGQSSSITVGISELYAIVGDLSKQKAIIYQRDASTGLFASGNGGVSLTIVKSDLDFANAVAIAGNYAAVAADNDKKVFIYTRNSTQGWLATNEEEISLSSNRFGYSLAMTNDYLIVGSLNADAAVFTRSDSLGWKTTPSMLDLGAPGSTFSTSVSISSAYAMVGGNKNVWIFTLSSSTGEWVFTNGLTKAIKDLSGTILTSEPPVSVSDELAAFSDPDRAYSLDKVFVVSVKNSNQVAKYKGAAQDSIFGGSVTVTDSNYLAVSTAGTNPSVVIITFSGSSPSETFNPSTTTTNSPLMVRSSGGAESVIVGDSSTGKAFVYSRGCPAGQYSSGSSCTDCVAGEFSVGAADATCSPCAAGSYSGARSMQCTACAPGKFANFTGSSQCAPCLAGLYSISPTHCQSCERGKFSVEGADSCTDCASGKFSNFVGSTACSDCGKGTYSGITGQKQCAICPAGMVSGSDGMSACTLCDQGHSPAASRDICIPCPTGTFANVSGSLSCLSCSGGTHSSSEGASECPPCVAGTYSSSQASKCTACNAGEYSRVGQAACDLCAPGTFSLSQAAVCSPCPRSTFTSEAGTGTRCLPCPPGRITPGVGSSDLDDCLNPASNFVFAVLTIPIALVLALIYLIRGRFKLIAFYRRERVARKLTESCRALSAYIYQYIYDAEARRVYITSYRILRVILFYTFGLIVSVVMILLVTLMLFAKVVFKAMIVVVSLNADLSFIDKIEALTANLASVLAFPGLEKVIQPFVSLIEFLVVFRMDFGFVNLTCEGSTSPMKLIVALFVMGVVIVIVQSNIALFKTVTYDNLSKKFVAAVFSSRYRIWDPSIFERISKAADQLEVVFPAKFIAFHWLRSACFSIVTVLLGNLQIFQIIPQYLASRVNLGDFIGRDYIMHNYDDSCNIIQGFLNFDTGIAVSASVIAWLLLLPAIYEISNILIPGIPSVMKLKYLELHTYDADYGKHKNLLIRSWWAGMSVLAPDLWLADTFQFIFKTICRRTPYKAGLCSPSVAAVEGMIREEDPTEDDNFDFGDGKQRASKLEEGNVFSGTALPSRVDCYVLVQGSARKEILEKPTELFYRLMVPHEATTPFRLFYSTRLINTSHIWNEMDISDADKGRGFYALLLVDPSSGINLVCKTYRAWSPKDWASINELSYDLENAPLHCGIILLKYGTQVLSSVANTEKRLLDYLAKIDLLTFELDEMEEGDEGGQEDEEDGEEKRMSKREEEVMMTSRSAPTWAPDARTRAMNLAKKTFKSASNRALFTLAQNIALCGGNVRNFAHSTSYVMIGSPKVHLESKACSFERWVTAAGKVYEQSYEGATHVTEHNLRSSMAHDITFTFKAPSGGIEYMDYSAEGEFDDSKGEGEGEGEAEGQGQGQAQGDYEYNTTDGDYYEYNTTGEVPWPEGNSIATEGSVEANSIDHDGDGAISADTETTKWRVHDSHHKNRLSLCLGGDSYTLHSLRRRTDQEKIAWNDYSRRELPSFFVLCVLEVEEVQGVHSGEFSEAYPKWLRDMPTPLLLVLCFLGFGHLSTYCGRRAMYTVAWKYYRFVLLCFGYWTEDLTEDYFMVHKTLRNHSLVWDHPEFKMNQAYKGESTSVEFEEEEHTYPTDPAGKDRDEGKNEDKDSGNASAAGEESLLDTFNLRAHHSSETPEMASLPEQELKMMYANDYCAAVSTLVATRATLLQVVPILVILSVFADLMASTPLLVKDKKLALSLPELIARDPFGKARRIEAEFTGTVNQMRRNDMSPEDDSAAVPEVVTAEIGAEKLEQLNEFNRSLKDGLSKSLLQPPLLIKEWAVTLKGISYFYYQSRLVQFFVQLYTFILVVGMLFTPVINQKNFIYAALLLFLPRGIIVGLDVAVAVGKILCITDEDLRVFWCGTGGADSEGTGYEGYNEEDYYYDSGDEHHVDRYSRRESSGVDFANVYGMTMSEATEMHDRESVDTQEMTENPLSKDFSI